MFILSFLYPVGQVSQFFIGRIDPTGFTMPDDPDDYDCSYQLSQLGRYLSISSLTGERSSSLG
jgi:hypothetical protein